MHKNDDAYPENEGTLMVEIFYYSLSSLLLKGKKFIIPPKGRLGVA